jgi:ABC-type nickel/cobalt efflux system permease component RcnA
VNDFLPHLLGHSQLSPSLLLAGLGVAFVLGAIHALSPGHGKTLVAAYLVGSRGTMRHAALLGAVVTFTHTISVFALGLGTLFLSRFVMPEKIIPVLGAVSGIAMVVLGGNLVWKRWRTLQHARAHELGRAHHHHDHAHHHDHGHEHHHHGPGGHTHMPEGEVTMAGLIALGASGGLVPCESAMVLLLSAISLGHIAAGLVLLLAFSFGLAVVLMAIGMVVIYAKHWLPDASKTSRHPVLRLVPVVSAAVIVVLGLLMTSVSLGWTGILVN